MKLLGIPDGIRSTVYMVVIDTLKQDPTLQAIIHPDGWRTYSNEDGDDAPPSTDTLPSIEILPFGAAAQPGSIVTQQSPLLLQVSVATAGLDVRDLLNLWEAVEAALFPGDGTSSLRAQMVAELQMLNRKGDASCIRLLAPAIKASEAGLNDRNMVATGTLQIDLRIPH
jgi:hypothetical protein